MDWVSTLGTSQADRHVGLPSDPTDSTLGPCPLAQPSAPAPPQAGSSPGQTLGSWGSGSKERTRPGCPGPTGRPCELTCQSVCCRVSSSSHAQPLRLLFLPPGVTRAGLACPLLPATTAPMACPPRPAPPRLGLPCKARHSSLPLPRPSHGAAPPAQRCPTDMSREPRRIATCHFKFSSSRISEVKSSFQRHQCKDS